MPRSASSLFFVLPLTALLALGGCAGRRSAANPFGGEPTPANAGDLRQYEHPANAQAGGGWLRSLNPWSQDANDFNKTAARQTQAIPKDDPLSLNNMPKQLGPEVFVRAAQVSESQGKQDQAIQYYRRALEISPNDEQALVGFARMHDRKGEFDQAVGYYRKALAAHPKSAPLRNDLAICLARNGQIEPSLQLLQEATKLEPQEALYRNNIAKVLVQANRGEEAMQHLTAVFPPAAAHYNLGYLLFEHGRHDLALVQFQQALNIDPAFARAAKMVQVVQNSPAPSSQMVNAGHGHPVQVSHTVPPQQPPAGPLPHRGPQLHGPGNVPPSGAYPRAQAPSRGRYADSVPGDDLHVPSVHVPH